MEFDHARANLPEQKFGPGSIIRASETKAPLWRRSRASAPMASSSGAH